MALESQVSTSHPSFVKEFAFNHGKESLSSNRPLEKVSHEKIPDPNYLQEEDEIKAYFNLTPEERVNRLPLPDALSDQPYETPHQIVDRLFLGAAAAEFDHRDHGWTNTVHIARPDYQIEVNESLRGAVRPPGGEVTFAAPGIYSNGEWIYPEIPYLQIKIPGK